MLDCFMLLFWQPQPTAGRRQSNQKSCRCAMTTAHRGSLIGQLCYCGLIIWNSLIEEYNNLRNEEWL